MDDDRDVQCEVCDLASHVTRVLLVDGEEVSACVACTIVLGDAAICTTTWEAASGRFVSR